MSTDVPHHVIYLVFIFQKYKNGTWASIRSMFQSSSHYSVITVRLTGTNIFVPPLDFYSNINESSIKGCHNKSNMIIYKLIYFVIHFRYT